jgi:hypothetical protein
MNFYEAAIAKSGVSRKEYPLKLLFAADSWTGLQPSDDDGYGFDMSVFVPNQW